jgi:hypothetical protein
MNEQANIEEQEGDFSEMVVPGSTFTSGRWSSNMEMPPSLEGALTNRISIEQSRTTATGSYSQSGLTEAQLSSADTPEEADSNSPGSITILRIFPAINCLPVLMDETYVQIVNNGPSHVDVRRRCEIIYRSILSNKSRWVRDDWEAVEVDTKHAIAVGKCYDSFPLVNAYNSVAVLDARTSEGNIAWQQIFDIMATSKRHTSILGVLHDNTLIDLRRYETLEDSGRSSTPRRKMSEGERDPDKRRMNWYERGFIDCNYTTISVDAGSIG